MLMLSGFSQYSRPGVPVGCYYTRWCIFYNGFPQRLYSQNCCRLGITGFSTHFLLLNDEGIRERRIPTENKEYVMVQVSNMVHHVLKAELCQKDVNTT